MDASAEIIRAAMDRLRATSAVTTYVGTRIYDRVPEDQNGVPSVDFPYVSLGPTTIIPDDADCVSGEEITFQFDVWTSGPGDAFASYQCRQITGAIKRALHEIEIALASNALVSLRHELTRILDDPNPAISHGAIQFTAIVETP